MECLMESRGDTPNGMYHEYIQLHLLSTIRLTVAYNFEMIITDSTQKEDSGEL